MLTVRWFSHWNQLLIGKRDNLLPVVWMCETSQSPITFSLKISRVERGRDDGGGGDEKLRQTCRRHLGWGVNLKSIFEEKGGGESKPDCRFLYTIESVQSFACFQHSVFSLPLPSSVWRNVTRFRYTSEKQPSLCHSWLRFFILARAFFWHDRHHHLPFWRFGFNTYGIFRLL
jgi:hypothetical protein